MGDTVTGNLMERSYQTNFGWDRDAALRPLVMAAVGSGLLVGGFLTMLAFFAAEKGSFVLHFDVFLC